MNLYVVSPLIAQLSAAFDARDFPRCARITKKLFLQDVCVEWTVENSFHLRWAEWQAGAPGSFRARDSIKVSYAASTKPSSAYRVGGHWSGGTSSGLTIQGSQRSASIPKHDFARAKRALGKLTTG